MRLLSVICATLVLACPLAVADPEKDAQAIVEATVSEEMMAATFSALSGLVTSNMQNEAAKAGKPLSDDAARTAGEMMVTKMVPHLVTKMRSEMAVAYYHAMSPEALAGLRAFLETPAGQEWASAQANLIRESTKVAESIAEPVAIKAVTEMVQDINSDQWPDGTLASTKAELRVFFAE